VNALSDEKRLIKNLLSNYEEVGIVGRPVRNTSVTVTVAFGLALIQILDLDEKNQILNTNVWSRYVRIFCGDETFVGLCSKCQYSKFVA